ncbi:SMC-Scp complex subunit ScpB [Defluviitalea phaphyphila]|uniref:SMC-Scp complex subunit ScpB n=1 Tax=Defluviitalea phaphyphila TaxID=1473580 RepID=UPI0007307A4E|nr:SMC-Scp complex subunit ScpB [Defluviitalea phaphyphila]
MKLTKNEAIIEAILFISGEAVPLKKIAQIINEDVNVTKQILEKLISKYQEEERGIQIIELNNSFQMCTSPRLFEVIQTFYQNPKKYNITQAALETLSIIAYKQPVTKAEIEEIRGVRSDHAINKLIEYNLICEIGRMDAPGKPILFGTTEEFLRYFGFKSLKDLPEIQEQLLEQIQKEVQEEVKQIGLFDDEEK